MTNTAAIDTRATTDQMATSHPYEDQFERWLCWQFENVYTYFRTAFPAEQFGTLRHNYGQAAMNRRDEAGKGRKVAEAWAAFAATKLADECKAKATELAAAHARGEITANAAVEQLRTFSGGRIDGRQAVAILVSKAG